MGSRGNAGYPSPAMSTTQYLNATSIFVASVVVTLILVYYLLLGDSVSKKVQLAELDVSQARDFNMSLWENACMIDTIVPRILLEGDNLTFNASKYLSTCTRDDVVRFVSKASMETAFDLSRCTNRQFKVFVYERYPPGRTGRIAKILEDLRQSDFATEDPEEACLFFPYVGTFDQEWYKWQYHNDFYEAGSKPYWNWGINHVIIEAQDTEELVTMDRDVFSDIEWCWQCHGK